MKYQKNIPATKPNKVQIPDQKTLTANAKVIIINEEGRKAEQSALPLHGMQDYLPAPRLMSLIATRMPATPTTTAMAIGATVVRIPSKDDAVTVDGHQAGAVEVCAKEATASTPGIARIFFILLPHWRCFLFIALQHGLSDGSQRLCRPMPA